MPKGVYIRTEAGSKNMSKIRKGKHYSPDTEFKKGYHSSNKTEFKKGKQHWNWKGGVSSENHRIRNSIEYHLWCEAVFARDNYICQECKISGGNLQAHHIFNFATYLDLRFDIANGITLCKKCHKEFHKKYGIKNNTKEQLEQFLNNKI